jgi:hypothetical protein
MTIVGRALPFSDLADPAAAYLDDARVLLAPVFGWRRRPFFAADQAELARPDVGSAGI